MASRGFTLAELLIALVILGMIATFSIPKVLSSQTDSKKKAVYRESYAAMADLLQQGLRDGTLNGGTFASQNQASWPLNLFHFLPKADFMGFFRPLKSPAQRIRSRLAIGYGEDVHYAGERECTVPQTERGLDISGQSKGYTNAKPYAQKPQALAMAVGKDCLEAPLEEALLDNDAATEYGPAQLLAELSHPESEASQAIAEALYDLPHYSKCRRIAVAGNSLMAAGAAIALAHKNEKVCLIEFGYDNQQAQVAELMNFDGSIGIMDVFRNDMPLDNLIITARVNRPHPQCYMLPQGRARADWSAQQKAFISLINALSRKFHRIIVSLPSLDKAAGLTLAQAGIGWMLADAAIPVNPRGAETLQQTGCMIHTR